MYLKLTKPIPPIEQMSELELPEFAVLIGRNGVGKTQLLNGIASGCVKVSEASLLEIQKYDINSFQPNDAPSGGWNDSVFFHRTIDIFFSKMFGIPLVEVARNIFLETLDNLGLNEDPDGQHQFEEAIRIRIRKLPDFSAIKTTRGDDPVGTYLNTIVSHVVIKAKGKNRNSEARSLNNDPSVLLCQAMKLSDKLPHELCRSDILKASYYEGDIIGNQLSRIFARYKVDQHVWAHTESEACEKSVQQLMGEYRVSNIPPWEILRTLLNQMREASNDRELFNFDFSDPEEDILSYANSRDYTFQTLFTNRTTGNSYSVTNLSSGEKIILCLCLLTFNRNIGRCQPKLLLLDELDTLLHPSMISTLITGLKDQFVNNGTRVIIATHSVTTVSLLEDGEVFRVSRPGNRLDVQPVAKAEAIFELSEGLATIEAGLKIATSGCAAPVTILTEGNNFLHLKRWATLFFGSKVKLFDKLPNRTGKNELVSYGRLLAKMETNSHFLIVWDCDARNEVEKLRKELSDSNNITVFSFKKRNNWIATKGIENNYDEKYLQEFTTTSKRNLTGEEFVTMNQSDKTDFAIHVNKAGTKDHFCYFSDLQEIVREILSE